MSSTAKSAVRVVPLGGLGEVGMNCLAIEQEGEVLVVDCGIRFPHEDLGLDVIHPDFTWLRERRERVLGVFLTHGHEDHVGGLPYLLRDLDVPVWGPPHALALVRDRLSEHGFGRDDVPLRPAMPGNAYRVGSFEVEPVRVAHSIVEATALRVETRAGTVLHTGDFNFDPAPPDGEPTDERRLAEIGARGVGLLLSDSTNVDVPEKLGSEAEVGESLRELVLASRHRVFIALFASNVQRLILLGDIAREARRKICLLGRSLGHHQAVAAEIRRLAWPSDLLVPPELARSMPRDAVLVLAGGTQGEKNSALSRLAFGTHPDLRIAEGDTVILSSRVIPGNERAVSAVTDALLRLGAEVHSRHTVPGVHTSGHATRAEQRRMIDLLRPRCFVPLHGTLHHLKRHAALAREAGVAEVLVAENGDVVEFDGERVRLAGRVPSGEVAIALGGETASPETLRQRSELARYGAATLAVSLDRKWRLAAPPALTTLGVTAVSTDSRETRGICVDVARVVEEFERRGRREEDLRETLRRVVRNGLHRLTGVRPIVEVQLLFHD